MRGARVQILRAKRVNRPIRATTRLRTVAAHRILEQMTKLKDLASDKVPTEKLRFEVLVSTREIEKLLNESEHIS